MSKSLIINTNIIVSEVTYLTKKHGFVAMIERMVKKYKLSDAKDRFETAHVGTILGVPIRFVNGRHNNRNFRKVLTGEKSEKVIFSA